METLIATVLMAMIAAAALGLVATVLTLIAWVLFLPFKLLGFGLKLLAFVLTLPFLVLFGIFGIAVFGAGILVFLLPFVPFALLAWLIVHLMRRRPATA